MYNIHCTLGNAEHSVTATLSHRQAASERAAHKLSVQKRDAPRKRSEPTASSVRPTAAAAASISCPAGFTIPAEPDPVCVLYILFY